MIYFCVYCGAARHSENGTGSDVRCCGEVGHVVAEEDLCPHGLIECTECEIEVIEMMEAEQ